MVLLSVTLCGFLSCTFPRAETKYQAKVLRDQGRIADAERVEQQAQNAPAVLITTEDPLQNALSKDRYDFPEYSHPDHPDLTSVAGNVRTMKTPRAVLPPSVGAYEAILRQIELRGKGAPSVEALYLAGHQTIIQMRRQYAEDDQGHRIKSEGHYDLLLMDALTDAQLQEVSIRLKGFHIERGPGVTHIQTDPEFFLNLATKYGGVTDQQYFELLRATTHEEEYPIFETWVSDYGTCVEYEHGGIGDFYSKWNDFRQKHPQAYQQGVSWRMTEVESALTERLCACGNDQAAVIQGFQKFLYEFPHSDISEKVTAVLHDIEAGKSSLRLNCSPG